MQRSATVPARQGLDFCAAMHALCTDICRRLPELKHIDMRYVIVSVRRARKPVLHGLQASLTPLRFAGGRRTTQRKGRTWAIQPVRTASGEDALYILSFYLPRFLDQPFEEKLLTVLHELWHISPRFDGDLRRFPGRCHLHSPRQKDYDAWSASLARAYLACHPPPRLLEFLRYSFSELLVLHGEITGVHVQQPKLYLVPRAARQRPG